MFTVTNRYIRNYYLFSKP